jgi:hypothetical protein
MRAFLNLRHSVPERQKAFTQGLERLGYSVIEGLTAKPKHGDVLVTWNRIREAHPVACRFEAAMLPVLVAENATWGNGFLGRHWYTITRNCHNHAGRFPIGDVDRWDELGVRLDRWRHGGETVILPQRGIGNVGQMPAGWPARALARYGGRIRPHPGQNKDVLPLRDDLRKAGRVITWGSGAAVQALLWGIPVISEMPGWIAEQDNTDEGRLAMFRRLAWAQWTLEEIASGTPFRRLLG